MLRRVWAKVNTTDTWKTKVEEHIWKDGTIEYSFRDRFGRTFNVKDFAEAQHIIEEFKMTDVTDEMFKSGWIHPDVYKEVVSQRSSMKEGIMNKTEVFFRIAINPFVLSETQSEPFQSVTEYKTRKEAKADAEAAAFAPDEYKIIRCERKVI